MFGGRSVNPPGTVDILRDTWEWDGAAWTQRFPAHNPGGRQYHKLVFDTNRNLVLLFGGYIQFGGPDDAPPNNEVWGYDGNDWTLLSASTPSGPPMDSEIQSAVFDSARGKMIVVTVPPNQSPYADATWEFDSATLTWAPFVQGPISPFGSAFAYDSVRGVTVGENYIIGQYAYTAVTMAWNGVAWTDTGAVTPPRDAGCMAFDAYKSRSVLYGCCRGIGLGYNVTDTWAFDGAAWTQILPQLANTNGYDAVTPMALVYDAARRAMILVGQDYNGSFGTTPERTYEYRYLDHVVIDRQPQATPAVIGQPAAITVYAAGAGTLTYQWRQNGVNLADGPALGGGTIAGAHAAALAINPIGAADSGDYDCVISNACGSVTSALVHIGKLSDFNGDGAPATCRISSITSPPGSPATRVPMPTATDM